MRASQLSRLCDFLENNSAAELYLVGDIVDFWALQRRMGWDQGVARLLHLMHRLARRGTRIILIPGNHDAELRPHIGREPAMELHRDIVHQDANGRRLLVTHGDEADHVVTCHPLLSKTGALLYDLAVGGSLGLNVLRRAVGLRYWNMAGALKRLVKRACTYIGDWEATLAEQVRARGLDGVVCGHIHVPKIGDVAGVAYYNCGDWVEHATALAETWDGEFILLSAHASAASASGMRLFRLYPATA
jgi:UDP-2,3-diacylglucosamine pyrophosphatase LpxH